MRLIFTRRYFGFLFIQTSAWMKEAGYKKGLILFIMEIVEWIILGILIKKMPS